MSIRFLLAALVGVLLALAGALGPAAAQDPTSLAECVDMMQAPLKAQCAQLFPGESEQRSACLDQVGPQVEAVCERFFGASNDFCSTCTSGCTANFEAGDGQRRECLQMCLSHPGCD